jgi:hypothetical protein
LHAQEKLYDCYHLLPHKRYAVAAHNIFIVANYPMGKTAGEQKTV